MKEKTPPKTVLLLLGRLYCRLSTYITFTASLTVWTESNGQCIQMHCIRRIANNHQYSPTRLADGFGVIQSNDDAYINLRAQIDNSPQNVDPPFSFRTTGSEIRPVRRLSCGGRRLVFTL